MQCTILVEALDLLRAKRLEPFPVHIVVGTGRPIFRVPIGAPRGVAGVAQQEPLLLGGIAEVDELAVLAVADASMVGIGDLALERSNGSLKFLWQSWNRDPEIELLKVCARDGLFLSQTLIY